MERRAEEVHDEDVVAVVDAVVLDFGEGLGFEGGVDLQPEVDFALGVELLVLR